MRNKIMILIIIIVIGLFYCLAQLMPKQESKQIQPKSITKVENRKHSSDEIIEKERKKNNIPDNAELIYNENLDIVEFKNPNDAKIYELKSTIKSYQSKQVVEAIYVDAKKIESKVYKSGDFKVTLRIKDKTIYVMSDQFALDRMEFGKKYYIQLGTYEIDKLGSTQPINQYINTKGQPLKANLYDKVEIIMLEESRVQMDAYLAKEKKYYNNAKIELKNLTEK